MKLKVLITAELRYSEINKYSDYYEFTYCGYGVNHEMINHDLFKSLCSDKDIIISEFDTIDRNVIDNSKQLKTIICCRGGIDTVVDVPYAKSKGINVYNIAGRNRESLAVHTIALILDLICQTTLSDRVVHNNIKSLHGAMPPEYKDHLWGLDNNSPYVVYRAPSISETTVGIIGFGSCGQTVYNKIKQLGFKTLIYDRSPETKKIPPGEQCSLDELLSKSDIVSLHASGGNNSAPIIGSKQFSLMKKTAYFINTSRGKLVDEDALIFALNNQIKAAAIDVSSVEPMPEDSKLLKCSNLIITPHIAGSSEDTILYSTNVVIDHLKRIQSL